MAKDLSTPEKRVEHVAHMFSTGGWQFERNRKHALDGFTQEEIRLGNELGRAYEDERYSNNCWYGRPEYGSRDIASVDLKIALTLSALRDGRASLIALHNACEIPRIDAVVQVPADMEPSW